MRKKVNVLSQGNVQDLAEKAIALVASDEGRDALKKAVQQADETTAKLSEARFVDPQSLRIPLNI